MFLTEIFLRQTVLIIVVYLFCKKKALRKRSRATTLYMWTGRPVAFWLLANGIFPSGGTGSASAVTVFQITALLVRSVMLDEVLG
jgi:hypothetical protein